jgi:hypothetical protein
MSGNYLTILESADHALFKMVRYVLLPPLRPELDAKTKTCLPAKTRFCHLDEQTICLADEQHTCCFIKKIRRRLIFF